MNPETILVAVVAGFAILLALRANMVQKQIPDYPHIREGDFDEQLNQLRGQLASALKQLDVANDQLKLLKFTEQELEGCRIALAECEAELKKAKEEIVSLQKQLVDCNTKQSNGSLVKDLLLIIAGDVTTDLLAKADWQQLQRIGADRLQVQRLANATMKRIAQELQWRRQDHTLYPFVHVTAHMGPEGVLLAGGEVAPPDFWLEQLQGVKVVFLNGCENAEVAALFAGMVDAIIVVYEKIPNDLAAAFCYSFWRSVVDQCCAPDRVDALKAYRQAISEVPTVRSYTDIRRR